MCRLSIHLWSRASNSVHQRYSCIAMITCNLGLRAYFGYCGSSSLAIQTIGTLEFPDLDNSTSWRLLRLLGHACAYWQHHEYHEPIYRIAVWSEHRNEPSTLQRHSTSTFSRHHGEDQNPKLHQHGEEIAIFLIYSLKEGLSQQRPQGKP